jgi:hypothetical protein
VKAVKQYPSPKSVKEVRAFLGLASFYRRLIPNFAEIAKPLTVLTRKDQEFKCGPQQQEAFQSKDRLCAAPVLAYLNFSQPFTLTTDPSKRALGAILSQVQDRLERPLASASRQTNTAEQSYTTSELEMLALVWVTKHFRCYLFGRIFLVTTHHAALTYLRKFADQNSHLLRWSVKLSELDIDVEHRAGKRMGHVDALSRHVGSVTQGNALGRDNVLEEQRKDTFCTKQTPGTYCSRSEFFLNSDGILYGRRQDGSHQKDRRTGL